MRTARRIRPSRESTRLGRSRLGDRDELWTETVGLPPPVYGERWRDADGRTFRLFEAGRSKLAAGLAKGWDGGLPRPGERWLYLGAATGTTASHVADLVGPLGRVYALERSPRPFARLLALADRWPNLLPILADARDERGYASLVPPVDGLYVDVAQPDQIEIASRNAALYLARPGSLLLLALKAASMGRERSPSEHLERSERALGATFDLEPSVRLEPFHRAHYLMGGRARSDLFRENPPAFTPPPARFRGRPRR